MTLHLAGARPLPAVSTTGTATFPKSPCHQCSRELAGEQLHSLTGLSRVLQSLRRLAKELNKPKARWKHDQIERKIRRWLSAPFLAKL
jgi:hypothetical protein